MYTASDPQNLTSGASVQSVVAAMGANIQPILKHNNLGTIDPEAWYPQQDYLNVFNELEATGSGVMSNLVSIGMKILDNAHFPPDVDTIEKALGSLDVYYSLNNKDKRGGWHVEIDGQQAICTSTTPYPADLEYGILYAMTRRFIASKQKFSVKYQDLKMREAEKGHLNPCVFVAEWH